MGVFSSSAINDIPRLLQAYTLGEIATVHGLTEGVENSSYFVETTQERLIATLIERRVTAAHIDLAEDMMRRASAGGLSVPRIIRNRAGANHVESDGRLWLLQSYKDGLSASAYGSTFHEQAGRALGRLHTVCKDSSMVAQNPVGHVQWPGMFAALESIDARIRDMDERIADDIRDLPQRWPSHLPSGPIHGDYFMSNVLCAEGRVSVIDFLLCCEDLYAYDLGLALASFGFDESNTLKPDRIDQFLEGYLGERKLSREESEMLPYLARMGTLRIVLSRLLDRYRQSHRGHVETKDPEEFVQRYTQLFDCDAAALDGPII
jgi:homoserine kinase type II